MVRTNIVQGKTKRIFTASKFKLGGMSHTTSASAIHVKYVIKININTYYKYRYMYVDKALCCNVYQKKV